MHTLRQVQTIHPWELIADQRQIKGPLSKKSQRSPFVRGNDNPAFSEHAPHTGRYVIQVLEIAVDDENESGSQSTPPLEGSQVRLLQPLAA